MKIISVDAHSRFIGGESSHSVSIKTNKDHVIGGGKSQREAFLEALSKLGIPRIDDVPTFVAYAGGSAYKQLCQIGKCLSAEV